ncbi:hypothetical protein RZ87_02400 [Enterobacter roggenkampii]|nr:hypothetical protein RZ87_02400 [Enterobacter roggenkampii]
MEVMALIHHMRLQMLNEHAFTGRELVTNGTNKRGSAFMSMKMLLEVIMPTKCFAAELTNIGAFASVCAHMNI